MPIYIFFSYFVFIILVLWKKSLLKKRASLRRTGPAQPSAPVPELPPDSIARTTAPPPWSPWTSPPPPLPLLHATSSPPYKSGAPGPVSPLCRAASPLPPHLAAAAAALHHCRSRPSPAPHSPPRPRPSAPVAPCRLFPCASPSPPTTGAARRSPALPRRSSPVRSAPQTASFLRNRREPV